MICGKMLLIIYEGAVSVREITKKIVAIVLGAFMVMGGLATNAEVATPSYTMIIDDSTAIFSSTDVQAESVVIPRWSMHQITAGGRGQNIKVILVNGSIAFSQAAGRTLTSVRSNWYYDRTNVIFAIRNASEAQLTKGQKYTIGENYAIEVLVENSYHGAMYFVFNGNFEVRFSFVPNYRMNTNALVVYRINSEGRASQVRNSRYENGYMVFTATHFGLYKVVYNPVLFVDIENHWAQNVIEQSAARGLAHGVGDCKFNPDEAVTRAEFIQFLDNVLQVTRMGRGFYPETDIIRSTWEQRYSDITPDEWFFVPVTAFGERGFLRDLAEEKGEFLPNEAITRQEVAAILSRVVEFWSWRMRTVKNFYVEIFNDHADIYFAVQVETAVRAGLLSPYGVGDRQFLPRAYVTRAQAVVIQSNFIETLDRLAN